VDADPGTQRPGRKAKRRPGPVKELLLVTKVSEEANEAAEPYRRLQGWGTDGKVTATLREVQDEMCAAIMAGMVALDRISPDDTACDNWARYLAYGLNAPSGRTPRNTGVGATAYSEALLPLMKRPPWPRTRRRRRNLAVLPWSSHPIGRSSCSYPRNPQNRPGTTLREIKEATGITPGTPPLVSATINPASVTADTANCTPDNPETSHGRSGEETSPPEWPGQQQMMS
jgi:hypothetical protein